MDIVINLAKAGMLLVVLASSACDAKKVVEMSKCAMHDDKLEVAFTDPVEAKRYLKQLGRRLDKGEPEAAQEAALILKSIGHCLK